MSNFREKLKKEIGWAGGVIYFLSRVLIGAMVVLLVLRYAYGQGSFWSNIDYFLLFFVLLDLVILNRVASRHSERSEESLANARIFSNKLRDPSPTAQDDKKKIAQDDMENEKLVFGLIVAFFGLNLLWMAELVMNNPGVEEKVFLPYRLNYFVLILGVILLSLNKSQFGFWLKVWLLKFRDPRAFIALALIFLIITPFLLTYKQEPVAEKAANMAYFMLVIGVLGQFVKYVRESRRKSPIIKKQSSKNHY
ncbi:MAG: hypothetical protein AB1465_00980 [Patescibacteria group bacterium]